MRSFNLKGLKIGQYYIIDSAFGPDSIYIKCRCDCGKEKIFKRSEVMKFLKCSHRDMGQKMDIVEKRLYTIWYHMKERCLNKHHAKFSHYGGRGITICNEWLKFKNFKTDMGNEFIGHRQTFGDRDTLLDRTNTDGNYEPSNCRWVTKKEQANNTRQNRCIIYNGEKMTRMQLSERFGIPYGRLRMRLDKLGWGIERAIKTPAKKELSTNFNN